MLFITEVEKAPLKFVWKNKKYWITKAILNKKNIVLSITTPDFKLYYRAIVMRQPVAKIDRDKFASA